MSLNARVLAVAGQPGGANAIIPVVRELRDLGASVSFAAFEGAAATLAAAGLSNSANEVAEPLIARRSAEQLLETISPDAVLSAATVGIFHNEIVLSARERGIPTIGVVDQWNELDTRFKGGPGADPCFYTPDILLVPDENVRERFLGLGCRAQMHVCGQPYLDEVTKTAPLDKNVARRELGVPKDVIVLLYASEPVAADYGVSGTRGWLGYTESEVLNCVLQGMQDPVTDRPLLIVRPHPRESNDLYARFTSRFDRVRLDRVSPISLLLAAADFVIGMTSTVLIEAACQGLTTLSLQPGLNRKDEFPLNEWGIGYSALDTAAAISLVRSAACGQLPHKSGVEALRTHLRLTGTVARGIADITLAAARRVSLQPLAS